MCPCYSECLWSVVAYVQSGKAPCGTRNVIINDEIDYVDYTDYVDYANSNIFKEGFA